MNILGGIWKGVKAVFGIGSSEGADRVMKVASGIGNWIDEQQFTPEERAEMNAKMAGSYLDFVAKIADENTERSRTRRDLALWIIRTEIGMLIASIVMFEWRPDLAEYIRGIATGDPMAYLVLGVGAFFFGAHIVRTVKQ